jgi:uncharacterized OB-fold protein
MADDVQRTWTGQLPGRTPETAPFWEACNRGEFLLQRCNSCSKFQYHYRAQCSHCWSSDIADFPSSGEGTVWTFSTVYKNNTVHYKDSTPYVVAVVELEGGVKVFGNVLECDPEAVEIGMPVTLSFSRAETGQMIPVFVAAQR